MCRGRRCTTRPAERTPRAETPAPYRDRAGSPSIALGITSIVDDQRRPECGGRILPGCELHSIGAQVFENNPLVVRTGIGEPRLDHLNARRIEREHGVAGLTEYLLSDDWPPVKKGILR